MLVQFFISQNALNVLPIISVESNFDCSQKDICPVWALGLYCTLIRLLIPALYI